MLKKNDEFVIDATNKNFVIEFMNMSKNVKKNIKRFCMNTYSKSNLIYRIKIKKRDFLCYCYFIS